MTEIEYLHERINATQYLLTKVAMALVNNLPVVSQEVLAAFKYASDNMAEITKEFESE